MDGHRDLNEGTIYCVKKNCGEVADVDIDLVNHWEISVLNDICKRFKPYGIFNID